MEKYVLTTTRPGLENHQTIKKEHFNEHFRLTWLVPLQRAQLYLVVFVLSV